MPVKKEARSVLYLDISPELKKEFKKMALDRGKSMTEIITPMIANWVKYQKAKVDK